jgi:hypothetical protein
MTNIEGFEKEVITLLCSDKIPNALIASLLKKPESVTTKFAGSEYLLAIKHSDLPDEKMVFDTPRVKGEFQGQEVNFVIYINNHVLYLECSNYSTFGVPESIRNGRVNIYAT